MSTAQERYAHRAYFETRIRTAPAQVLVFEMLRNVGARLLEIERSMAVGLEPEDWESVAVVLDILGELNGALRVDVDPWLCESLSALYAYAAENVLSAVVRRDVRGICAARRIIASLIEATVPTLPALR
ncbi:MAG: flagellar protein FliS [Myxococcales bacterium]|nr:flagellar protein FliS [Myxococcales bacterium]